MVNFQETQMKIPLKCIKAQQGNFIETYQQEGKKIGTSCYNLSSIL